MFILTTALIPAVLLIAHSTAILIRPPRPNIPDRPSLPKPIVPVPIAPRPINPFGAEAAQQEIFVQGNIQKLEDRLGVLGDGVDFAGNMIEAILPTTTTTSDNTGGAQVTPAPAPTSTLPHISLLSCSSYASILSSCASATISFFNLPKDRQAPCACYSASTTDRSSCTVTAQTWDGRYDAYEQGCYGMFKEFNYSRITDAMDNIATLPGRGLCGAMSSQAASGTGTGIQEVLARTTEGSCAATSKPPQQTFVSGARRWTVNGGYMSVMVVGLVPFWGLVI